MSNISYLTDAYDGKIQKINDLSAPINFVFITDMHHGTNRFLHRIGKRAEYEDGVKHIESIRYILDRCPGIRFVVSGGDIGNEYDSVPELARKTNFEIMDALYRLPVPVHCVVGNHDDMTGARTAWKKDNTEIAFPPEEMHTLCMRYNPTGENYYYIDLEEDFYRIVFLNTSDKPYFKTPEGQYPFGWRLEISEEQAEWVERDALSTDRKIIIISHAPIHNAGIIGTGDSTCFIKEYDDLLNGPRIYNAVKKSKNVVAMLAGHVHFDNLIYDDKIPVITTLCSLVQEWMDLCPKRKTGTITETAFDVVSIKGNRIYLTRFGAGEDRVAILPFKAE